MQGISEEILVHYALVAHAAETEVKSTTEVKQTFVNVFELVSGQKTAVRCFSNRKLTM